MKVDLFLHGAVPIIVGITLIAAWLTGALVPKNEYSMWISCSAALFPIWIGINNIRDILKRKEWYN